MNGFVDLHCHILPYVDDGPKTCEDALDMLRIAKAEGFAHIVATPHYAPQIPGFQGFNAITTRVALTITHLETAAKTMGITLHTGSEIRLDEYSHENLKAGKCLPLGKSRHVLLELPDNADLEQHYGWMSAILSDGWIPVLAHVERLRALQSNPLALEDWVEAGCLLQVNASSLAGGGNGLDSFGDLNGWTDPRRKTAKALLKKGLCHIVATDAHSPGNRPPLAREAYKSIAKWVGEAAAHRLFSLEPRRILGLPLELP